MTNAEKYLKDGVDEEEFVNELHYFWWANEYDVCDGIRKFLNAEAKKKTPTLTEDERVILRNIVYDSEYKYIYRSLGMLYLSENEKLTCVDRLPAMHHLFQFIKERRRI